MNLCAVMRNINNNQQIQSHAKNEDKIRRKEEIFAHGHRKSKEEACVQKPYSD